MNGGTSGGRNNGDSSNSGRRGVGNTGTFNFGGGNDGPSPRARAGGREVSGLNAERMREVVEMINRARAVEIERNRRNRANVGNSENGNVGTNSMNGEGGGSSGGGGGGIGEGGGDTRVVAPTNTPASGDDEGGVDTGIVPPPRSGENGGSELGQSMLIVQMTIMENGVSRELVALVGTDMTVETLQRILQAGAWTSRRSQPASQDMMNSIPKVIVRMKGMKTEIEGQKDIGFLDVEELTCVVCCEDFGHGEIVRQMPCNPLHCYHDPCIMEWLARHNSCPICRAKLENPEGTSEQEDGNDEAESSAAPTAVSGRPRAEDSTEQTPTARAAESTGEEGQNSRQDSTERENGTGNGGGSGSASGGGEGTTNVGGVHSDMIRRFLDYVRTRAAVNYMREQQGQNPAQSDNNPPNVLPFTLQSVQPRSLQDMPAEFQAAVLRELERLQNQGPNGQGRSNQGPMLQAARVIHRHLQSMHQRRERRTFESRQARLPPMPVRTQSFSSSPSPVEPRPFPMSANPGMEHRAGMRNNAEASRRLPSISNMLSQTSLPRIHSHSSLPRVAPTPWFLQNHRFSRRDAAAAPPRRSSGTHHASVDTASLPVPPRMESSVMETSENPAPVPAPTPSWASPNSLDFNGAASYPHPLSMIAPEQARPRSLFSPGYFPPEYYARHRTPQPPMAPQISQPEPIPEEELARYRRQIELARSAQRTLRPIRPRPTSTPVEAPVRGSTLARQFWRRERDMSHRERRASTTGITPNITARRRRRENVEVSSVELEHQRSRRRKRLLSRSDQAQQQQAGSHAGRFFPRRGGQPSTSLLGSVTARLRNLGSHSGGSGASERNGVAESAIVGESHRESSGYDGQSLPRLPALNRNTLGEFNAGQERPTRHSISVEMNGIQYNGGGNYTVPTNNQDAGGDLSSNSRVSASEMTRFHTASQTQGREETRNPEGKVWRRIVDKVRRARRVLGSSSSSTASLRRGNSGGGASGIASISRRTSNAGVDDRLGATNGERGE